MSAPRAVVPTLIAGRGRGMLSLAGEIADVVHMASWFINVTHFRANLDAVRAGAERAGRTLSDLEIAVSIPVCSPPDRNRPRRAARSLAGQAILWMAGADRYSQLRSDWRPPT